MRPTSKEKLKNIAKDHGGEILSKKFRNVHTKMRFKCKDGHIWWAFPFNINAGTWCPKCGNKRKGSSLKLTMDVIQALAEEKGLTCLSTEYVNGLSKLSWECEKGHKFKSSYHSISRRKRVCKRCPGSSRDTTSYVSKLEKIVEKHGGEILSDTYVTSVQKMRFKCKEGHIWWAQPCEIKKGTWCRKCFSTKMSKKYKNSIAEIRAYAKSQGGKCLSDADEHKNSLSSLRWECAKGHAFNGSYHITTRRQNFCKVCAGTLIEKGHVITPDTFDNTTIFNLKDVAKKTKISVVMVRKHIKDGELKASKLGGQRWVVSEEDFKEFALFKKKSSKKRKTI